MTLDHEGRNYRYEVTKVTGRKPSVKVGTVLLYRRARGPVHVETIMDTRTFRVTETWTMKYLGTCDVKDGKVVRVTDTKRKAVLRGMAGRSS